MDATLHALADLLLKAIPTVVFFVFLTVYLKYIFFEPLGRILEERKKATEGVRELAQRAFEAADKKNSEFEHALHLARMELHHEHEELRRKWAAEQAAEVAKARAEADRKIEEAKHLIAEETRRAQAELEAQVDSLSEQIVRSLLKRRAA